MSLPVLDRLPGDTNLYIGGLFTLRRKDALKQANITHVLSVLRAPLDNRLFEPYQHMTVEVDDVEDENLLEHFPATNKFIQDGLDAGGGVLVHCAMGKSRSATCVIAYLMHKHGVSPEKGLSHLRKVRQLCEPNEGFMKQLEIYHEMGTPDDVEAAPAYQRWLYQREIELARACGQAPDADKIRFEDEQTNRKQTSSDFELKCRKCRTRLATSQYVLTHDQDDASYAQHGPSCAHYFLDPLSWMRPELEKGDLDGRLECPKCHTNVGKYAWQGMKCSCGLWVVPGISLARGRVDELKTQAATIGGAAGIRRPPGAAAGGGGWVNTPPKQNL